jgi:signal peptidase I
MLKYRGEYPNVGKELALRGLADFDMTKLFRVTELFWAKEPLRWLFMVVLSAFLGIAAGRTVIASVSGSVSVVDGLSMEPTYQPGSRVYTAPISTPLQRADIVLIDDGDKEYALKRLIGLPGEKIELWRGYVFVNGKMLIEPYLPKYTYTFPDERNERVSFKLREDEYFVLGDNRTCSDDSRNYGPVQRKHIKSRVPPSETSLRARLTQFTPPRDGQRLIRPFEPE